MSDATLTIRLERQPGGGLARIAAMLHRRNLDVAALRLAATDDDARVSELVLALRAPRPDVERLALAIGNLVDVHAVAVAFRDGRDCDSPDALEC